tara:strand:- start:2292 stop:3644 length:1353 start_codon:yes stop_codon:yes gene_type:complete
LCKKKKKLIKKIFLIKLNYLILLLIVSCTSLEYDDSKFDNPQFIHNSIKNLTDVIVYDIFSPPVASRVYSYPIIAAYEILRQKDTLNYNSLAYQLNGLKEIPKPQEPVNFNIAAIEAIRNIGKSLIFSEARYEKFYEDFYSNKIFKDLPKKILKNSKQYGLIVSEHILNWASKDNYNQTRTFPKYTIKSEDEFWKPTPPDYMDGIEPHWSKIRTMVIDSSSQFPAPKPFKVNLKKNSPFYGQLMEVYNVTTNLSDEQVEMAKFWDCNPYVSHHKGHAMFATKKITPGGHWINICKIVSEKSNSNDLESIRTYALVSIALFDSFISCWDEKWKTIVVRPETLINEYIDEDWLPLLQTPPFPEYTSGHSVISRASAVILTKIFGDEFSFDDTSEIEFGLPMRSFDSFIHASDEAAISRLYGGIHYEMAISNGVTQGQEIGDFISNKLMTKKN